MRYLALTAALMMSGSAVAQETMDTGTQQPSASQPPMSSEGTMTDQQPMTTPPADSSTMGEQPMQDQPMQGQQPMADQPMQGQQPMANQPTTTDTSTMGSTSMQSSGTPERDARGIPVVSDMATAPSGANAPVMGGGGQMVPAPNQSAVFATQPSSKTYQACSRTVTDGCVQAYERGSRRPGR